MHVTSDSKEIPVVKLQTEHLINIINLLKRNQRSNNREIFLKWIGVYQRELNKRNNKVIYEEQYV